MNRAAPFLLALSLASASLAADRVSLRAPIEGPVEARLVSVVDGDTLLVEARPWPHQTVTVLVRIRGIDAPELKARCVTERQAALRAKERLVEMTSGRIRLSNIAGDKYFGRVVADMTSEGLSDIGASLLARGLVKAYDGGRRKSQSC